MLGSCAVPPKPPPKFIQFDEYMVLAGPKFIKDYSYLDFVLSHRLVPDLAGTIRFRKGAVDAKYNYGQWMLMSIKQICIGKGDQLPVIKVVPNELSRQTITASLLLSKNELEMVLKTLQELKFNLSCSGV